VWEIMEDQVSKGNHNFKFKMDLAHQLADEAFWGDQVV
jgi:hypothetical protein